MKVAPVFRALNQRSDAFRTTVVHTGQHYDDAMSSVFFEQLGLPEPDAYLNVGSGSHGAQTARVMIKFEEYLLAHSRPAGVVVVGDVNSTAACALTAVKLGIPVAHVEAGLRSFDRTMPEEINRVVTDAIADLLLVGEPSGIENLKREGVSDDRIRFIGNVMIDTLVHELEAARALNLVSALGLSAGAFALVTLHRPSNVDEAERLGEIVDFLRDVCSHMTVLFPIHPRTRMRLEQFGLMQRLHASAVRVLEPLGYREMLSLMEHAQVVLTDSGGVQEETTFLGVPCVTLRENTERPITVAEGTNTLVGRDLELARRLIDDVRRRRYKRGRPIAGWDGHAAPRAADALVQSWK
jgi:UDP-N-acetylglucosamine 2-epimerase (non-hydrolysing)